MGFWRAAARYGRRCGHPPSLRIRRFYFRELSGDGGPVSERLHMGRLELRRVLRFGGLYIGFRHYRLVGPDGLARNWQRQSRDRNQHHGSVHHGSINDKFSHDTNSNEGNEATVWHSASNKAIASIRAESLTPKNGKRRQL
jgi:hypothetical protein